MKSFKRKKKKHIHTLPFYRGRFFKRLLSIVIHKVIDSNTRASIHAVSFECRSASLNTIIRETWYCQSRKKIDLIFRLYQYERTFSIQPLFVHYFSYYFHIDSQTRPILNLSDFRDILVEIFLVTNVCMMHIKDYKC